MAGSFPALFSGQVALFPLEESTRIPVEVLEYTDFTEQRWPECAPLRRFVIHCEGIKKADRDSIQSFIDTQKGGFDKTWDITVAGNLYSNMMFLSDEFHPVENEPEHWTFSLACAQSRKN